VAYFVVDQTGAAYGPADEALLQQWVREGRVQPGTTIRDATSGQTMLASAVPGLFLGGVPYGGPPAAGPVPGYAYYPRPAMATSSNDITVAWILSIVGLVCAFCVCSLIGLGLGIGGLVFARRALGAGDPRAQVPLITSWAAIGIGAVMVVVNVFGLISMRM